MLTDIIYENFNAISSTRYQARAQTEHTRDLRQVVGYDRTR